MEHSGMKSLFAVSNFISDSKQTLREKLRVTLIWQV